MWSADRLREKLLAVRELEVADRQRRRRGQLSPRCFHGLNEVAVVAERLNPPLPHLGADVRRGDPFVARAAPSSVQRVAGEEPHMGADRCLGNDVGLVAPRAFDEDEQ